MALQLCNAWKEKQAITLLRTYIDNLQNMFIIVSTFSLKLTLAFHSILYYYNIIVFQFF